MPHDIDETALRRLLAEGISQREIARRLGIPRTTLQEYLKRQGLAGQRPPAASTAARGPSTVDVPPVRPSPSTVDPLPSTVDQLRLDLQAAVTAALQPVLTRLEALETGQARPPAGDHPPSTVDPETGQGPPVDRHPSTVDPQTWEMRPVKHSVRWTIYVPQRLKDEITRRADTRHQPPSLIVQELLWQALNAPPPSTP
jgi:transcriptional regulator with XRE-family HTH domain